MDMKLYLYITATLVLCLTLQCVSVLGDDQKVDNQIQEVKQQRGDGDDKSNIDNDDDMGAADFASEITEAKKEVVRDDFDDIGVDEKKTAATKKVLSNFS